MHEWRAVGDGVEPSGDSWQRVELRQHGLGGVVRAVIGFGDHERVGLAGVVDLVAVQDRAAALLEAGRAEITEPGGDLGQVLGCPDRDDARHLGRARAIHGADARVRHGRAAEGDMEGAVGLDVVRVPAVPSDQAPVLDATHAAADVLGHGTRILIPHDALGEPPACSPRAASSVGRAPA